MAFDPARAKSLFLAASELASPTDRAAYLDIECGDDAELRARVEALLAADAGVASEFEATAAFQPDLSATQQMSGVIIPDGPQPSELVTGVLRAIGEDTHTESPPTSRPTRFVPGQVIAGRYTLLEVLGEGGMGTVYKAEQSQPVKRQVALKLIKVGMDSRTVLARFDAERQALAMMDHPNIARVFDGGTTEANQPFFVMEFVHGVAITDYCDRNRLSVDARLQLFVAVCQAVQHAHQKGIIHRDIKPSNVMVTEVDGRPTPKVIDFGVAKATEFRLTQQTLGDTGAIVGTPTYMSPEQADPSSMDIDTRTDVYALGVILYELLAGSTPLDPSQFKRGALLEMLRMVREVDPSKPSTKVGSSDSLPNIAANRGIDPERLKRELRGDLDWIVMKALEKDRTRRYETANGLGADIQRHLASEPVLAAPPSRSYRLRKFVRKHRAAVIAASMVLLALLAGITGTTLGLLEARRQEVRANERAEGERLAKQKALEAADGERKAKETFEAVLGFVENKVFAAARPKDKDGGLGIDVKLADAITAALPSIENDFPDKPHTEARLRSTIGQSFMSLGKFELAKEQFQAALALSRRELGPEHPDTLTSLSNLAVSYQALGRFAEALKLNEETLTMRKAKLGLDHPETLASMNNLAISYQKLGRIAEALKLNEETLALKQARLGRTHPDKIMSLTNLAISYHDLGRNVESLKINEELWAILKAKFGPNHPETLASMNNLAESYRSLGRHAEALRLNEQTLALLKVKLGSDHPMTIASMNNLVNNYQALSRHADALKLCEQTLALTKVRLGPDHPATLGIKSNLAISYYYVGRHAEALKLVEEILALTRVRLGHDHPETLRLMGNLANIFHALGRHAEGRKLHEETLAMARVKLGPDHPDTLWSMNSVAESYLIEGRRPEALSLLQASAPKDSYNSLMLAGVHAWFGDGDAYSATRKWLLESARETTDPVRVYRATLASALRPSSNPAELDALLALGRKAVELEKEEWELLALGMAEYRNGHFAAADEAFLSVEKAGSIGNSAGISAFYRAMSLFQLGKKNEAKEIATKAADQMKPPPEVEQKPFVEDYSEVILWLAYKEAKAMIGFEPTDAPSTPQAK